MHEQLISQTNIFLILARKYAAAPEFVKLKDDKRSKLWFGNQMSKANDDKFFAIMDKDNIKNIEQLIDAGIFYADDPVVWYLQNGKTQETIQFIINRYNKYFPKLDGFNILSHLQNDGSLDPDSGSSSRTPIFILVHDLIHQVLQSNFVSSLEERDSEGFENTPLIDELYEDIASSLSNFQPSTQNISQGILNYIKNTFTKKWEYGISDLDKMKKVIEDTFHQAKAELRGKIDKLTNKSQISNEKIPNQIKQLIDGILSKMKYEMLNQADHVNNMATNSNMSNGYNIFGLFNLDSISKQYYDKIMTSKIVEQADSSALRAWMLECLQAMQKLNNYFRHDFEIELMEQIDDQDDE